MPPGMADVASTRYKAASTHLESHPSSSPSQKFVAHRTPKLRRRGLLNRSHHLISHTGRPPFWLQFQSPIPFPRGISSPFFTAHTRSSQSSPDLNSPKQLCKSHHSLPLHSNTNQHFQPVSKPHSHSQPHSENGNQK